MLKAQFAGLSNVGKVRTSNEDSMGLFPDLSLFIVADGMGGHAAGEVASSMAVQAVSEFFASKVPPGSAVSPEQRLESSIQAANQTIYEAGKKSPELSGMGTTIVGVLLDQETAYIAHVGDSRAYFIRNNQITQLTKDHSLINEYLNRGMMTPEEAEHHPLRHVLSRALGTSPEIKVDLLSVPVKSGDFLLLCSDGLSNTVAPDTLLGALQESKGDAQAACKNLVEKANLHGGLDNITVVILRCVGPHENSG